MAIKFGPGGGGGVKYEVDTGVRPALQQAGHSVRAQAQKMRGHWVRA